MWKNIIQEFGRIKFFFRFFNSRIDKIYRVNQWNGKIGFFSDY